MGRTGCTEPQCLYKGDLYLFYVDVWETGTTVRDNNVELQMEMRAQLRVPADLPLRKNLIHNCTDCLMKPTAGLDSDYKLEIV